MSRPKEGETTAIEDTYAYNGEGLRTSETIGGTTSYLAWDSAETELPSILGNGTYSFVYGPDDMPIEQINNSTGTVLYLHHDQQGSTRLLTGSTGKTEATFTYDAYGNQTGHTGTATTPLGYDAQYTSTDTGLVYLRNRVYDPATAQFLSVDPLKAITGEPYSYAGDNPINYSDPTGLIFGIPGTPSWEEVGEGIVGWGDTITFGGTEWVREQLGDNNINACSGAYEAGGIAGLVTGVLIPGEGEAEIGAEGLDEALAGLRESKAGIYEVDNEEELQALYNELSRGGKPATPTGYDGEMVKLSDGTRVGLRNTSSSGGQTIDINRPGQAPVKIHLP